MENNLNRNGGITWHSISENIDIETGEIISNKLRERDYIIIRKTKKYEINGKQGIVKHTNECERSRQLNIWGKLSGN